LQIKREENISMKWLDDLQATEWTGTGELWLDPEGNKEDRYDCSLRFEPDSLHYTWSYEGQTKEGSFTFNEDGAVWIDSWHQPDPAKCAIVPKVWGLFTVEHSYEVPSSPSWGWRSKLSERPNGELALQMTNIAPWGEEGRAVRMTFTRVRNRV